MLYDELGFKEVHDTYRPKLLRYLAGLVGEQEAEDLTQEVFIRVSRGLKDFRGESQLSTWIYRIATNAAIDRIRASARGSAEQISLSESDETIEVDGWTGEETPSLEQLLMRKEMYECFLDYVKHLPMNYRTVVLLSELGEFSNNDIAGILGLSLDTVKIRLHRGRLKLFQELKSRCKAEDWL